MVFREPGWDDTGMASDLAEPSASELAESMRAALRHARWDPDGDPAVAVDVLDALVEGVCGPVDSVAAAQIVFDSEAMGTAYLFCASTKKAIDRNHPTQPPAHRGLSLTEHLALVRPLLPGFHRRQQEVLQLLNREFPPED
ncbi:hypothetical protein DMA10_11685 [Streptomyces sp. WAC 01420]|nr:hypothetical protein DLM49_23125 [Streptomyces sp. WAC 01438]RSM97359.1 hypothetical protein DMA10_11685 [Streptomyces sp. WAC 01420]